MVLLYFSGILLSSEVRDFFLIYIEIGYSLCYNKSIEVSMKDLYLSKFDSDETNACKIVGFVRAYEREQGLSDDEIAVKYTQAYCSTLADAIRMVFGACLDKVIDKRTFFSKETENDIVESHTYAEIGETFVDIFGAHTEKEAIEFVNSGALSEPNARKCFEENKERFAASGNLMYICLGQIHAEVEMPAEHSSKQSFGDFRSL